MRNTDKNFTPLIVRTGPPAKTNQRRPTQILIATLIVLTGLALLAPRGLALINIDLPSPTVPATLSPDVPVTPSPTVPATATPSPQVTATPATPAPTSAATTPQPDPPTAAPTPSSTPAEGTAPVEGRDFSFLRTEDGEPVGWACDEPITVALADDVPAGADTALDLSIDVLTDATGLPLTIGTRGSPADITIHYDKLGATRGDVSFNGPTNLGKAQTTMSGGHITGVLILIRNDTPNADPATLEGQSVLTHELAHALGLGHADQSTNQLMTPTLTVPVNPELLGPGDLAGLAALGCNA